MKKTVSLVLSFTIILSLMFSFMATSAFADSSSRNNELTSERTRVLPYNVGIIEAVAQVSQESGNIPLTISRIKTLKSFDGTNFVLVEFGDFGYLIMREDNLCLNEYSIYDVSPYSDCGDDDELYYAGVFQYFILKNGVFSNIKEPNVRFPIDSNVMDLYVEAAENFYNLDTENGIEVKLSGSAEDSSVRNLINTEVSQTAYPLLYTRAGTPYYIGDVDYVANLNTTTKYAYYAGRCVYNALAVVLFCLDECLGREAYIDDDQYLTNSHTFANRQLTYDLSLLGNNQGTLSKLQTAFNTYKTNNGFSCSTTPQSYSSSKSLADIFDYIFDEVVHDNPTVLAAYWGQILPVSYGVTQLKHAVAVYGRIEGVIPSANKLMIHTVSPDYAHTINVLRSSFINLSSCNSYGDCFSLTFD